MVRLEHTPLWASGITEDDELLTCSLLRNMESPLDNLDVLYGFDSHGRTEPIRMLYHLKGVKYEDHRVAMEDWQDKYKSDMPLGALPVLKTSEGTFNLSNSIARHVARKFGLMGEDSWEATLHDVILENMIEGSIVISQLFVKRVYGGPEPSKSYDEIRDFCLQVIKLIQGIANKRSKKFLVSDQIGLGDVWVYTTTQYWKMIMPTITEHSDWLREFEKKMEAVEGVKSYLEQRPKNNLPKEFLDKLQSAE